MKLLIAYIQPDKLTPLRELLSKLEVFRYSISDGFGHSEEKGFFERYRGVELDVDLMKKIRLEIALNDEYVSKVVDAMLAGGKDGSLGDGKIFVLPIEETYRLSTGESGPVAIG